MRSAIFDNDSRKIKRLSSPVPGLKKKTIPERKVPWNLEEMIIAYQENGSLPPMLSPTLPPLDSVPVPTPIPTNQPIVHDKNVKANKQPEVPVKKKIIKSSKVKYVNKLNDSTYPRLLVRFTLGSEQLRRIYKKSTISKPSTPVVSKAGTPFSKPSTPKPSTPKLISKPSTPKTGIKTTPSVTTSSVTTPNGSPKKLPLGPKKMGLTRPLEPTKPLENKEPTKPLEQKEPKSDFNTKSKLYWMKLAKECNFMANSTEGVISLVIQLDSLMLFAISYSFDDKISPSPNNWSSLIDDIDSTTNKIKQTLENNNIRIHLRFLMELLQYFKIFVLKKLMDLNPSNIVETYKKIDHIQKTTEKSFPDINDFIKTNYSKVWKTRSKLQEVEILPIDKDHYLPLGPYLDLNLFLKVFYKLVNGFIDTYNNVSKEDLFYSLKSGLPGP
ncbi:hypothetical protein CLIB1444_06S00760 [[Candida] jaroonii]|uniref:Uncharacterized protein n=1 Tax=[Candida] jaroonii TaxID=467808 RepID=A0ACA9Y974_9ASCO|nr:hypothetical protein CLIB1444_06S00760 [[Candida] jaroonii]